MGKEIKTRQIHKDIKVLDKAITGTERIKHAYVRTKESAEQTRDTGNATPVEYAENKVSNSANAAAHETAHQVRKQGGKVLERVKEKRDGSGNVSESFSPAGEKDVFHQPKEHIRKSGQELAKKRVSQARIYRELVLEYN